MEISQLIPHVEALIFAADRPLPVADILELLNNALAFLEDRATQEQVEAALEAIQEKYNSEFYAFSVRESGGGFQFLTKKEYYQTVAQLNGEKFLKRLSTAALETLAIIAYKQPISKGEIEHIRGVSTDYSITKLLEKELIIISGRSEELPGKPLLYSTSKAFMDYFGLNSPKDLPKLKEVFDEDFVPPTQLSIEGGEELEVTEELLDDDGHLIVSESGELTETTTIMMDDEVTEESDGLEQETDVVSEENVVEEDDIEDALEDDAQVDENVEAEVAEDKSSEEDDIVEDEDGGNEGDEDDDDSDDEEEEGEDEDEDGEGEDDNNDDDDEDEEDDEDDSDDDDDEEGEEGDEDEEGEGDNNDDDEEENEEGEDDDENEDDDEDDEDDEDEKDEDDDDDSNDDEEEDDDNEDDEESDDDDNDEDEKNEDEGKDR